MIPREERGPVLNGLPTTLPDVDPEETQEWIESLDKMVETDGPNRARIVLLKMLERARSHSRLGLSALTSTDYINTIAAEDEEEYPGDAEIERNIRRLLRWNSAITVHRAQRPGIGVGGHISTYASAVTLYEVGQNHFWRGQDAPAAVTKFSSRGTPRPVCTLARSWRASQRGRSRWVPSGEVEGRAWSTLLPAPSHVARLLAVPDGVDGSGPDEFHLPGVYE